MSSVIRDLPSERMFLFDPPTEDPDGPGDFIADIDGILLPDLIVLFGNDEQAKEEAVKLLVNDLRYAPMSMMDAPQAMLQALNPEVKGVPLTKFVAKHGWTGPAEQLLNRLLKEAGTDLFGEHMWVEVPKARCQDGRIVVTDATYDQVELFWDCPFYTHEWKLVTEDRDEHPEDPEDDMFDFVLVNQSGDSESLQLAMKIALDLEEAGGEEE